MLGYQDGEDSDSDAGEVEVGMSLLATWEAHGSHVGSSLMRQCVHDSALCLLQTNRHVAKAEWFTNTTTLIKQTETSSMAENQFFSPNSSLSRRLRLMFFQMVSSSPAHRCFLPRDVRLHRPSFSHHLPRRRPRQSFLWNSRAPPLSEENRCRWKIKSCLAAT